jgi:hypothetical protein
MVPFGFDAQSVLVQQSPGTHVFALPEAQQMSPGFTQAVLGVEQVAERHEPLAGLQMVLGP